MLVQAVFQAHPEYAADKAKGVTVDRDVGGASARAVTKWYWDVLALFSVQTSIADAPQLHGRLLVLGLCLLDPTLVFYLNQQDELLLPTLIDEIKEGFLSLLSSEGNKRYKGSLLDPSRHRGTVAMVDDRPATTDGLQRQAFAELLAIIIRGMRQPGKDEERGPIILHLDGPWGSGKSTLLDFMRKELQKDTPEVAGVAKGKWVVVEFNAWLQQRLGTPWWWLAHAVVGQGIQQLWQRRHARSAAVRLWIADFWWRSIRAGSSPYVFTLVLLAAVCVVLYGLLGNVGMDALLGSGLEGLRKNAQAITAVIALISAVWAIGLTLSRALLLRTTQGAKAFMNAASDPMESLTNHFRYVAVKLKPVVIFVDDLDRCQSDYAVQLLEGILTIFSRAPVTYVIAADGRWLRSVYEHTYQAFVENIAEPGRPLSYLFLEKVFQLSTAVPLMQPSTQKAYWRILLHLKDEEKSMDKVKQTARNEADKRVSEADLVMMVRQPQLQGDAAAAELQVYREEAAKRLVTPEVSSHTESALERYASYLDPNPRAMKRFLNVYQVQRSVALLTGTVLDDDPERDADKLAMWTLLLMRFPTLADYLAHHPEMVDADSIQDMPGQLQALFHSENVQRLLKGESMSGPLSATTIKACVSLFGIRSSF
jgi:hypothetical protein